jgi:dihydroceramidase
MASPWSVAIEFCEPAYVYSPYIAEFYNTFSSFIYSVVAVMFFNRLRNERKKHSDLILSTDDQIAFIFCGLSFFVLGFGSALLHATQTLWGELIDEISMLCAMLSLVWCQKSIHPLTSGSRRYLFMTVCTIASVVATAVYIKILYHNFFASVFFCISAISVFVFLSAPIYTESEEFIAMSPTKSKQGQSPAYGIQKYLMVAMVSMGTAFASWLVDQACVRQDWPPHDPTNGRYEFSWYYWCHPLWHIGSGIAAWYMLQSLIKTRVETALACFARTRSGQFILRPAPTGNGHSNGHSNGHTNGSNGTRKTTIAK